MKSRKLRIALAVLVLAVPAYWWLLVESGTPTGVFDLDVTELRRLADSLPGEKPETIRVEEMEQVEFPKVAVVAGAGWTFVKLPVFAYQLGYADRTVMVDTSLDPAVVKNPTPTQTETFARISAALEKASLIVVTHEHFDHVGGLFTHPRRDQLAARLTDEQLADPSKYDPLVLPAGAFKDRVPFSYQRAVAIAPGVVLWKARGHTPGSQMVFVKRKDGEEFLLLGDVSWHSANYEQVRERARLVTLIMGEDRSEVLRQLAAVNALVAAEPKLHVIPGHDGPAMKKLLDAGLLISHFGDVIAR